MQNIIRSVKIFWNRSIQRQLILGIALVHAILMTIFVTDLVSRQHTFLKEQSMKQTEALARSLAANSVSWVLADDVIGLEEIVDSQKNYPDIEYAMILSPKGKVLAHTEKSLVGLYVQDPISLSLQKNEPDIRYLVNNSNLLDISVPIFSAQGHIGWSRVAISTKTSHASLRKILRDGVGYTFLAILVGSIFAIFMARGITNGIRQLLKVTSQVEYGKIDTYVEDERQDELGQLGKSFNKMINRLNQAIEEQKSNENELNKYRNQLEDLVTQRTKELEIANNSLEQEIIISKQAEISLKESEQRFRTVADFTFNWEYWVSPDNQYVYVSPSCKRITGYIPDDFINNPDLLMEIIHPDDRAIMNNHTHIVTESGGITSVDFRIITKDGDERWISHICQPVYDNDGHFIGRRGTNRDITGHKKMQREVLKAHKLESIATLAGGIAHDFNNLLFMVMGNISLAQDDLKFETETSESLKAAQEACNKAKELSAQLITFSKGGEPIKQISSINDLLKDAVTSALQGVDIKPEFFITDAVRQVNIDENQIRQVFYNLIVNAKEAMDDNGQLKISCENIDIPQEGYLTLNQGKYIKISFKDHGCGIAKNNLEQIFDPYFSTKERGSDKGQGLGLAASYSIIEKHKGLITVESEPGTGSIFTVYLKAALAKETDLKNSVEKPLSKEPVKQTVTGKRKILLMDDEESIRSFLGQVISRLGYNVETCTEGKEAVATYKNAIESKEPFDAVILDLTNKIGMGGQETMKKLIEIDPAVRGIVITGYFEDPVVANFRAYGFSGFLTKPATRDELNRVINEVILYS